MLKNAIMNASSAAIRRNPWLRARLRNLVRGADPSRVLVLDYPISLEPRYPAGHPELLRLIDAGRASYAAVLQSFPAFADDFVRIAAPPAGQPCAPTWFNSYFSGLDGVALYSLLCRENPRRYVEIGSGNSTLFTRRAIRDHGLRTRITSIDPNPRAEIDSCCDEVVRCPGEAVDPAYFEALEPGDFLFIDGSHRVFMNSDVVALFLDVLPRLRPGVLVHVHDIFLPYDYPQEWGTRYYSEQYLLAAYLLGGSRLEIILPNQFVTRDAELAAIVAPIWARPEMRPVRQGGGSFWVRTR